MDPIPNSIEGSGETEQTPSLNEEKQPEMHLSDQENTPAIPNENRSPSSSVEHSENMDENVNKSSDVNISSTNGPNPEEVKDGSEENRIIIASSQPLINVNKTIVQTKPRCPTMVVKSIVGSSTPTTTTPNKILYVKYFPNPSQSSVLPSPTTIPIITSPLSNSSLESVKVEPQPNDSELKKFEPTTSSGKASSKPIEHTVNLLNNNRILIKSVKTSNLKSTAPTQPKTDDDIKYADELKLNASAATQTQSSETNHRVNDVDNGDKIHIDMTERMVETQLQNELQAPKIKREFEQLQKAANESKVISEFIGENPVKRGRRPAKFNKQKAITSMEIDTTNVSYTPSPASRSTSKDSDRSVNSSLNASTGKRNTRSRNTDFSAKQKRFLKGFHQYTRGTDDESENNSILDEDDDDTDFYVNQEVKPSANASIERRKSISAAKHAKINTDPRDRWDKYCWRCHHLETTIFCCTCSRSYHAPCIKMKQVDAAEMEDWQCSECIELKATEQENKKKKFDVKHFNKLLKYTMNRILQDPNLQQFQFPVSKTQYPDYNDVIIYPINLSKIEDNIDNSRYTSSEAFLSDMKWILHNCSIYFSDHYKVTRAAKSLQKVCKQEINDIDTCPECYLNANTMTDNWFTETCAKPHLILWAKLKGFPFWPAKAMSINGQIVDVRFFSEHDRAHVPSKDCYLYSVEDPNPPTNKYKRNTIADCVKEVDVYIENIKARFGSFNYSEVKTPFNPQMVEKHLIDMIPGVKSVRGRRKSIAKSDLTLKIVKTADNHLSVVKKDQIKESPQIKRTIDITGDGAVSRTPTPPAPILSRRKTEVRNNRNKATARYSDGQTKFETDKKSYQMLRRKSMAVEKPEPKKVGAVIFKRKSIHSKFEAKQTEDEAVDRHFPKPISVAKKRKPSVEQNENKLIPEKRSRVEAVRVDGVESRPISDDEVIREENILSSVGLMKRTAPMTVDRPRNSTKTRSEAKRHSDERKNLKQKHRREDGNTNGPDKPTITLVPFVEIKEENSSSDTSRTGENTVSSLNTTAQGRVNMTEQVIISSTGNSITIKDEIDFDSTDDDDSLMIIEDDFVEKAKPSSTPKTDNRPKQNNGRASISVKDISKMTGSSSQKTQQVDSRARKSFPKSVPATNSTSILKPRSSQIANRSAPMNNMVSIPLDGLPPLDLITSSSPPPLSVVSATNHVSLLTRNQAASTSTTSMMNEPPPLSISSIQVTSNQANPGRIYTVTNGMVTEQLASAIADTIIREPPKLTERPKAPLRSDGGGVFPTESGSVCQTLMENAHKMTDFFRSVIEDTLSDLVNTHPEAKVRLLELELEKQKNAHTKELADLKANTDRLLAEMKKSVEKERVRVINETRKQCELERIRSVEEAKKKQWCAYCGREAQFFCCWNTSYCNHACQRNHWEVHMDVCSQVESTQNTSNSRRPSVRVSASKSDGKTIQVQTTQQLKSLISGQKERANPNFSRSNVRVTTVTSPIVPGLRNILPKNAVVTTSPQPRIQQNQTKNASVTNQQSSIAIINRPIISQWHNQSTKSASLLLHQNAILLPSSFATISSTNSASSGVSLMSSNQSHKSSMSDTIIIQ